MSRAACDHLLASRRTPRVPRTLWLGLGLILLCEALLFLDVARRGGTVIPYTLHGADLRWPSTWLGQLARRVAWDMTPLCWVGYLLLADGLLTLLARCREAPGISSIRSRPNRFVVAWLTSIPVWCFFDWVNFYFMHAWRYHGLPSSLAERVVGYFVAFAAISPGMFLAAQLYQKLGLERLTLAADARPNHRLAWMLVLVPSLVLALAILTLLALGRGGPHTTGFIALSALLLVGLGAATALVTRRVAWTSLTIGAGFVSWTFLDRSPLANMALWVGLVYLLDPINGMLGQPSLLGDWNAGRLGRTLALFAGGATCGLLWEFWNYWALAKWTYHLPFLGPLEHWRYFEMPLPGFLGFLPFAAECWVMLHLILGVFEACHLRLAEPLPDEGSVF